MHGGNLKELHCRCARDEETRKGDQEADQYQQHLSEEPCPTPRRDFQSSLVLQWCVGGTIFWYLDNAVEETNHRASSLNLCL